APGSKSTVMRLGLVLLPLVQWSGTLSPLPSTSQAPSNWLAAQAPPHRKSSRKTLIRLQAPFCCCYGGRSALLLDGLVAVGEEGQDKACHSSHQRNNDGDHHAGSVVADGVNKGGPAEHAHGADGELSGMERAHDAAGDAGDHTGDDEGQLLGQGDAVNSRLGDAGDGRNKGRGAQALQLL